MAGHRFYKGVHILFGGREYVIDQRLHNTDLRIKDVITENYRSLPELELVEALFDGHLEFLGDNGDRSFARSRSARCYVQDLSSLDDNDPKQKKRKEGARRRYRYVNATLTSGVITLTKKTLAPLIEAVATSISDPSPPCWSTLYNWVRAYRQSGEDIRVLVPSTNKRGNTTPMYSGRRLTKYADKDKENAKEVAKVIDFTVQEKYLTRQRLSVLETYKFLEGNIKEINKFRKEEERLPTPHPSSFYYYISKLDEYEVDVARYGKRYAERRHSQVSQSPRPTRPLERVQMDHTKTNLMTVDLETRLPIGRAMLTDALDVFSKMPLGSYISFEPASYLSVMQCLLNAIKPKTYIKKLYPDIENVWNCYGLPELLIVDNGKEFHSVDLEDACIQLGITLEYSPPGCPEYKGAKERYYETLNNQLLHCVPGTTFSDFLDKEDYDPLKNAIIDVERLKKIHHIYMIDLYARQKHRGIGDVPARRWEEGISVFPPALPPKGRDLRILLGYVEYRMIRQQGVEMFGLFYNCNELSILRRETKGQKVKIKYDPTDISVVYVADSKNGLFLPVPAVDQEYTLGLSLFQHDVIRNYARKIADSFVDSDALWRARKKIEEIVERAWNRSNKSSTRTRLARFKGIGLNDYWNDFEGEEDEPNPGRLAVDSERECEQLRVNPADEQHSAGVSDVGISLDDNHAEDQSPEDAREVNSITGLQDPMSDGTRQKGSRRGARRNGGKLKANALEISTDAETVKADDELLNTSSDGADGGEWGGDYGQMSEEVLKWQK